MGSRSKNVAKPTIHQNVNLLEIREEPVLLDFELAAYLKVETRILNQAVKRNIKKFPKEWAFQLTDTEFENLKSQNVISSGDWGGRRKPPIAFSEHGVVLAATLLNSETAIHLTQDIVRIFISVRRNELNPLPNTDQSDLISLEPREDNYDISSKVEKLLETTINPDDGKTVREEAGEIISAGFAGIKAYLIGKGVSNKEIETQILKAFAEMELILAKAGTERQLEEKERQKNKIRDMVVQLGAAQADKDGDYNAFLERLDSLLSKD